MALKELAEAHPALNAAEAVGWSSMIYTIPFLSLIHWAGLWNDRWQSAYVIRSMKTLNALIMVAFVVLGTHSSPFVILGLGATRANLPYVLSALGNVKTSKN